MEDAPIQPDRAGCTITQEGGTPAERNPSSDFCVRVAFAFACWDEAAQARAGGGGGTKLTWRSGAVAEVLVASERRPGVGVSPIDRQHIICEA